MVKPHRELLLFYTLRPLFKTVWDCVYRVSDSFLAHQLVDTNDLSGHFDLMLQPVPSLLSN